MTNNRCDSIMMIFESILRVFTCGMNRWSKVIKGGVDQIKGELDIYNYMQKLRLIQTTLNCMTTFQQRRLIEANVEASFLISPFKKSKEEQDADKDRKKKLEENKKRRRGAAVESSSESDEDFGFLEQMLKDNKELDEQTQRLLFGIIQKPWKEKKSNDKLTQAEIWERRRQRALERGEQLSDDSEYSGEVHDYDLRHGSDTIDESRTRRQQKRANKVANIDPEDQSLHPPCPPGFDPDKWDRMSLAEKCKYLGMTVDEWLKMNRE